MFIACVMKGDENTFPEINFWKYFEYLTSDTSLFRGLKKRNVKIKDKPISRYCHQYGLSHGFLFKSDERMDRSDSTMGV
ncbi:MAG: hypothetical protein IPL13_08340 [Saprospiraceae bacterium]|nr:hypothetical protein [Candidatus Brachybacter algidus]